MTTPAVGSTTWAALLVAGSAFEAYTLKTNRHDDTLSQTTRRTFHVTTPAGRAAFLAAWGGFSAWYALHVTRGRCPSADDPGRFS